jgi:hypothetical protein
VSEYQYYEFRAVDQPLSESDRRMLASISSRGAITATSFTNTYNWGNFKGDPDTLMETCFDAFVYLANWGTRRFVLRLPSRLLGAGVLMAYCGGDCFSARKAGESVVLEFAVEENYSESEDEDDSGWMASLIQLRADLLGGDYRCLYLGWLLCAQNGEIDDDDEEPDVPAGLDSLSAPLRALIDFMDIDPDLVEVAAQRSGDQAPQPEREALTAWLRQLPEPKKTELLVQIALREDFHIGARILAQFQQHQNQSSDPKYESSPGRTVRELLAAAHEKAAERKRLHEKRRAAEKAQKEKELAEKRARYLESLDGRKEIVWREIATLIQTKRPNDYDRAASLLTDLRDLARLRNEETAFQMAVGRLRETHASKPSFLRRLDEAKL